MQPEDPGSPEETGVLRRAPKVTDQVEFHLEHKLTKGKEIIMKGCTYSATLDELLKRPMGLLALHGRDGEPAEGTKPEADENADESKDGGKPAGDTEDESGDDKDKGEKPDAKDRRIANLEEEKDRHLAKRREAETALAEANRTIKQLQKDGSPDDALKKSNDDLTTTNTTLQEQNRKLALQVAFLTAGGHDWVDAETAMSLVDTSGVEFDEKTGKAIGLKSALDKLAKDKPFLLKPKAEGDEQKPGTGKPPAPRSTTTQSQKAATEAALRAKYPALRRG